MLSKVLSLALAASLLLYCGCRETVQLSRERFVLTKPTGDIVVLTKDYKYYRFLQYDYFITNDSLKGTGRVTQDGQVTSFKGAIAISDIEFVETEQVNSGKTALAVVGIAFAAVAIVAIVAMAAFAESVHDASHSCPFVYAYDGTSYHFESETFSGAVLKGLERTSYDNLRYLKPVDGRYRLRLSNERPETQYVNEFKLLVVDHPASVGIIPDLRGSIHTISAPQKPLRCTDFASKDVLARVTLTDSVYWESDLSGKDFEKESDLRDGLVLEFAKPVNATTVKLIVNGVNTRLGDFAFQKVFQLKGDNTLFWYQQLEHDSSERAMFLSWMMREGMLHVKVWRDGGWREQAALVDVGPSIAKDQLALLDVRGCAGPILKVKLECTTDLWRIDRVAVDYTPDLPVTVTELAPAQAVDEKGNDVSGLMTAVDENYYVTVEGQHADVTFRDIPRREDMDRSYVVKTRGFYYQWTDAHGPDQANLLRRVLTEPQFAAKKYLPEWKKAKAEFGDLRN